VISADNERISVKTITTANHVSFKKSTFHHVNRALVLRINVEEGEASIEELLDCAAERIGEFTTDNAAEFTFYPGRINRPKHALSELQVTAEAAYGDYRVRQYENGTIVVMRGDEPVRQAKPALREIAAALGVPLVNGNGNPSNTRQLGAAVLAALQPADDLTPLVL
jgi:hypothetical protein